MAWRQEGRKGERKKKREWPFRDGENNFCFGNGAKL